MKGTILACVTCPKNRSDAGTGGRDDAHRVALLDLAARATRAPRNETVVDAGHLENKDISWQDSLVARMRCFDLAQHKTSATTGVSPPAEPQKEEEQNKTKPKFVVAKLASHNYAQRDRFADADVAPPPYVLASMVRSNLVEYVACLLRDRSPHHIISKNSGVSSLDDLGATIDVRTGERVVDAPESNVFRSDKDQYRAVINTAGLPERLSEIYAYESASRANKLRDMKVPSTVYTSDDLIDLASPAKVRVAAEIWFGLLARAGIVADLDAVVEYLLDYAERNPHVCNLEARIYNLDQVRKALEGTLWERHAYCPDEWATRVAG